ncbi:MAG TPA: alpha/beta fold hydrolase [Candidatus Limnocylindria bacterium]|nr:alpha/beta fold hydrolase [Candidatus Limnocylindria bacterium]
MTIAAVYWPRRFSALPPGVPRFFEVEAGTQVLAKCHWQENPREHSTLIVLHGLEGSSESNYMLGIAEKAWTAGFNAVRLNQRNCGGTEHLSATLYHSGLSNDIRGVILELIRRDRLPEIFAVGFSMGGNLVLKMAGESGDAAPSEVRAFAAVAPALDLASCADALAEPQNFIYEQHFVRGLKKRMRYKASLFPGKFPLDGLSAVRTVREFDEVMTARFCGFKSADDYYARSSARRVIAGICRPVLVITAQDDTFVPFAPFQDPAIQANKNISLVAPEHGGHCAFISEEGGQERFWAEARIIEFCKSQSRI